MQTQIPNYNPGKAPVRPIIQPNGDLPYQRHNPPKGEELQEFINERREPKVPNADDDELEDYEQTETTINQPRHKFPDDDGNVGDDPLYPEDDETTADDIELPEDDDDEVVTSIGTQG